MLRSHSIGVVNLNFMQSSSMDVHFAIHDAANVNLLFICLALLTLLLLSISFFYSGNSLNKRAGRWRLPPGPAQIPVLGNFHLLGKLPHRSFFYLSKIYGPIVHLRLGSVPTVAICSASMAAEIIKTQDQIFSSRPITIVGKCISYDYADAAYSPYSSHWRYMRKVVTVELLTFKRLEQHRNLRMQEVCAMIQSIQDETDSAAHVMPGKLEHEVDLVSKLVTMGLDLISRMMLRERFTNSTRKEVLDIRSHLATMTRKFGEFVVADYVPWLSWFDPYGNKKQIKIVHEKVDRVLDQILCEHEEASGQRTDDRDYLDTLLHIQQAGKEESKNLSREAIKATLVNLLIGGSDTSSHTIVWAVSELLRNPELLQQARAEVDAVIGHTRMVDESDIPHLTFLQAIVKETFRLHPPLPLLLPHESLEDCKVAGYDIPRATRVFVNAWAIGRDPCVWERPLAFYPQRFLEERMSHIEALGQYFGLIPFGSGRRGCPGMALGSIVVQLTLACLLHAFDWSLRDGQNPKELDMQETPGLMAAREKPLMVILKPRVSATFYMEHQRES